jgi:hypothetical protein
MALDTMDPLHVRMISTLREAKLRRLSVTGVYTLLIPVLMKETRSGVILTNMARKMRKETGDHRFRARVEEERGSLRTLIWISCTRPIRQYCSYAIIRPDAHIIIDLLCTEPVVASFSVSCLERYVEWQTNVVPSCGLGSAGVYCTASSSTLISSMFIGCAHGDGQFYCTDLSRPAPFRYQLGRPRLSRHRVCRLFQKRLRASR